MVTTTLSLLALFNLLVCGNIFGSTFGQYIGELIACHLGITLEIKNDDTGETKEIIAKGWAAWELLKIIREGKRKGAVIAQGGPYCSGDD